MSPFSQRLKRLRKEHHYSQAHLANIIGVNKQTISQYERGVREPNFSILLLLCDVFCVSADYLFGRDDAAAPEDKMSMPISSASFNDRFKYLRIISGKAKSTIATDLNVSKAIVTFWENGKRMPSREMAIAIADYFNVGVDYLLGTDENPAPPISAEEMAIAKAYRKASKDTRAAVRAVLSVRCDP